MPSRPLEWRCGLGTWPLESRVVEGMVWYGENRWSGLDNMLSGG